MYGQAETEVWVEGRRREGERGRREEEVEGK